MKKLLIVLLVLVVAVGIYYLVRKPAPNPTAAPTDYKNAAYEIEGGWVQLHDGSAQSPVSSDSSAQKTTKYFGNEVRSDFNGDGKSDVAFLLTQETGGSGTFYYLVVALGTDTGYEGTNGIFIGDRIAPQTTEFRGGEIIVNFAVRKVGEPMTADPSVGVSKYFKVVGGKLVEDVREGAVEGATKG